MYDDDKPQKLTITLSGFEMRKLKCWAEAHGKPTATYGGQIIGARIESNLPIIDQMMTDIARFKGISVDELEKQWLKAEEEKSSKVQKAKFKKEK
jgi:hypothetical protein